MIQFCCSLIVNHSSIIIIHALIHSNVLKESCFATELHSWLLFREWSPYKRSFLSIFASDISFLRAVLSTPWALLQHLWGYALHDVIRKVTPDFVMSKYPVQTSLIEYSDLNPCWPKQDMNASSKDDPVPLSSEPFSGVSYVWKDSVLSPHPSASSFTASLQASALNSTVLWQQ